MFFVSFGTVLIIGAAATLIAMHFSQSSSPSGPSRDSYSGAPAKPAPAASSAMDSIPDPTGWHASPATTTSSEYGNPQQKVENSGPTDVTKEDIQEMNDLENQQPHQVNRPK